MAKLATQSRKDWKKMKKCIIVALMVLMVVFIVTFSFSENYNQVIDTNNSMIGKLQAELKNKEKYKSELASDPNIRACADLENKINEMKRWQIQEAQKQISKRLEVSRQKSRGITI